MVNKQFEKGFLEYKAWIISQADVQSDSILKDPAKWTDGYLAFSNTEKRLRKINLDWATLIGGENGKADIPGIEGYLMEIGLWRKPEDGKFEEIIAEREETNFFVQHWLLTTQLGNDVFGNCYYRSADTQPRPNSIFADTGLHSLEVVVYDERLHFFITVSEKAIHETAG